MNRSNLPPISVFERYLSVWVLLCIVVGIALGQMAPGIFQAIGRMEVAQVNLPVGGLIWIMIVPMLLKVDFGALGQVKQHSPIVALLLGLSSIVVPWDTLLISVVLYIVIPVIIARYGAARSSWTGSVRPSAGTHRPAVHRRAVTLVLLFAFQGQAILRQPLVIAMLAVPILIRCSSIPAWPTGSTAVSASTTSPVPPR